MAWNAHLDILFFAAPFDWVAFKYVWAVHGQLNFVSLSSQPRGGFAAGFGGNSRRAKQHKVLGNFDLPDHIGIHH